LRRGTWVHATARVASDAAKRATAMLASPLLASQRSIATASVD
jgi:hypothetical protein